MEKVALVTGSSSGIGFETSLELARKGYYTFASMRNLEKASKIQDVAKKENLNLETIKLDVNDEDSIKSAIQEILSKKNRIDVLVNNAGYMLFGAIEDITVDGLRKQFETNFFAIVRIIQEVAPIMRRQKDGVIVNISSVVGRIGLPGTSAYITTKFALEGLSECMRYELSPHGVKTVIIEPGAIKSNFMSAMETAQPKPDSPYKEMSEKILNNVKMLLEMGTEPSEVAKTVVKAVEEKDPLPRYVVGNDAQMFLEAKKMKTDIEFENYIKKELF